MPKNKGQNNFNSIIYLLITIILSILTWIAIIVSLTLSVLFKKIIEKILQYKYTKEEYGGIFNTEDIFYSIPSANAECVFYCVIYLKFKEKFNDDDDDPKKILLDGLQKNVFDDPDHYPKLTSIKKTFCGYPFWIRRKIKLNDVLTMLNIPENVEFNEKNWQKEINKIINTELPKNGSILWDVHLSTKPIKSAENNYKYPILFRWHHVICDANSFTGLLINFFADKNNPENIELFNKQKEINAQSKKRNFESWCNFSTILLGLEMIFISLGRIIVTNFKTRFEKNPLHSKKFSGKKIVAWSIEECFPMVKSIKNSKISNIVNTAAIASLICHLKRNSSEIPKNMSPVTWKTLKYAKINRNEPILLLKNNSNVTCVSYDVNCSKWSQDFLNLNTLKCATEEGMEKIRLADILIVNFLLSTFCGYVSTKITKILLNRCTHTFIVENLSGISKIYGKNYYIENVTVVAPTVKNIGITFTFLTYADRFQISVSVDERIIKSPEEVQKISDDILDFVKLLIKK